MVEPKCCELWTHLLRGRWIPAAALVHPMHSLHCTRSHFSGGLQDTYRRGHSDRP
jgi:hypothetical protein